MDVRMNANTVKNMLMRYFRFNRDHPYVATECWKEDVVASDGSTLVCVEVKISMSDYRREYAKRKHKIATSIFSYTARRNNPNRVYFAAPHELACKIAQDLVETKSKYGCLAVHDNGNVVALYRAAKLHSGKVMASSLKDIVLRISSELITVREQVRP